MIFFIGVILLSSMLTRLADTFIVPG
jgi:hypothetical protein